MIKLIISAIIALTAFISSFVQELLSILSSL